MPLYPSFSNFRLTVNPCPFSASSMLIPRCRGSAVVSVFTSKAKHEPWMPLLIQVFVPFTT